MINSTLASFTIRMFGGLEVQVAGNPLPTLRTRKGQELLALLTLKYPRDVEREWLSGTLWPASAPTKAAYNLRRSLSDLRQALGDAAARLQSPTLQTLRLELREAEVDVIRFDAALARGDMASLTEAVVLYRGPLLETCYEEWAMSERSARERAYLEVLEALAAHHTNSGHFDATVHYLQQVVAVDATRETSQRRLMEALATSGNYGAMLQAYRALRLYLHDELQTEPDAETTALYQRLRVSARTRALATSASPREFSVAPLAAMPSNNLPRLLTSFIGRETEKAEVIRLLRQRPLLTLTGMGGSGKTRLALEVASAVLMDYPEGVWLVEFAPLSDPTLVTQAVATALGIKEKAGTPLLQTLFNSLQSRNLLLLLDNCEHLVSACAGLANALLRSCPQVRVLATSRETLGIAGEQRFPVPCLTLPSAEESSSPEYLHEYEAIRLFVERARLVSPDFVITAANAPAVAAICQRLDGLPLALELAAAQVRGMSVETIQTRLDDRFRLLTGGSRTVLPRHRTLRVLMDWSYALLSEAEQVLLARTSVFSGGWTLEAVERVAGDDITTTLLPTDSPSSAIGTSQSPPASRSLLPTDEVLDLLLCLVDKSLVLIEEQGGTTRYRLLETVRAYVGERLEALGQVAYIEARHREWCAEFMEAIWPKMREPGGIVWLNRMEAEHDNMRAALGAANDLISFRIAATLWWLWNVRSYWSEGSERLSALLKVDETISGRGQERARVLWGAGVLADNQGDLETARVSCEASLALCHEINDRQGAASVMSSLGIVVKHQGDLVVARSLFEESMRIAREIGDRPGMVTKLINLGNISRDQGDYEAARGFYEESLIIGREFGERRGMASVLNNLGDMARKQGDYDDASALYQESVALYREVGDQLGVSSAVYHLGRVALHRKDYRAAQSLLEDTLQICLEIGNLYRQALVLNDLGLLSLNRGDTTLARSHLEKSLQILQKTKHLEGFVGWLERMAALYVAEGKAETATRLWGEAEARREVMGLPLTYEEQDARDRQLNQARITLGAETFETAWQEGRTQAETR